MEYAVSCRDLSLVRDGRKALDGISFSLAPGGMLGLSGPNGAGKSTLLKLILGLIRPAGGRIDVLGGAPGERPAAVGYVPENVSFYDHMTVAAHIEYFRRLRGVPAARAAETAERLGLAKVASRRLSQCSKGERQRLGLAQALLASPKLLVLDEPTVGLDAEGSALLYREMHGVCGAGGSVIVCTHELALADGHLDSLLVLAGGRMRAFGKVAELKGRFSLPARVGGIPEELLSGGRLPGAREGNELVLPEAELPHAVRILAGECGCCDFTVKRPGLADIYRAALEGAE